MGTCLCPRCHVTIAEVQDLGNSIDSQRRQDVRRPTPAYFQMVARARKSVFKGYKVSGPHVDVKLGGFSRVPTVVSVVLPNGLPPPGMLIEVIAECVHGLHPWDGHILAPHGRPVA